MKIPDSFLVECSDYHYYDTVAKFVKDLTSTSYKHYELSEEEVYELNFTNSYYVCLIYTGKRPNWDKIKKLKVINFDA